MKISLSEKEKKEWRSISKALDASIEEASYWNDVLFGYVPRGEWMPFAKRLDPKKYTNDPFFKKVRPTSSKEGDISLCYREYKAYQGFVYDEIRTKERNYLEKTPFGYFDKDFPFLAIQKGERTWMSVIPHEINTMKEPLSRMHGKTLILGLGLGYFAYMSLLKEEVSEVTVIENDPKVIALFNRHILPFFPKGKKFKIVKGDAFEYLKKDAPFESCFADLWHMPEDGLPMYLKLRKIEERKPEISFSYWIEASMLALVRRALIVLFDEAIEGGIDPSNYEKAATYSDRLVNALYQEFKDVEIDNMPYLRRYLDFEGLRRVALLLSSEA